MYHQKYYKVIGIDLLWSTNTSIIQEINFTGRLKEDNGAAKFFIAKKQQKSVSIFYLDSLNIRE